MIRRVPSSPLPVDSGFTLIELLVGATLMMVVLAAAASFVSLQLALGRAQPEWADLQQRARAAADLLASDLATAGAWSTYGGDGRLFACCVPSIQPRRIGARSADPPGSARPDALTLIRASARAVPGRLREPLAGWLVLENQGGCRAADPVCGLDQQDTVLVFDDMGRHQFFLLGPPGPDSVLVFPRQTGSTYPFAAGATAVASESVTYYFDRAQRQLRQYDGFQSDTPIVDEVVSLRFEYRGTAGVPELARAAPGTATCWFEASGLPRFGRPASPPGTPDVPIDLSELNDGPWCGDDDHRFDADLLRIRQVRATIRLAAHADASRGSGPDFLRPGGATSAARLIPDLEVVVDVAPRHISGGY